MALKDIIGADVATIFTAGGFTVTATHSYNGDASSEDLEVLFDAPYDTILGDDRELESARPQMLLPRANAGNIGSDSNFTINGILYYIIETQDDASDDIIKYILSEDTRQV
jgi:hypothetical protein